MSVYILIYLLICDTWWLKAKTADMYTDWPCSALTSFTLGPQTLCQKPRRNDDWKFVGRHKRWVIGEWQSEQRSEKKLKRRSERRTTTTNVGTNIGVCFLSLSLSTDGGPEAAFVLTLILTDAGKHYGPMTLSWFAVAPINLFNKSTCIVTKDLGQQGHTSFDSLLRASKTDGNPELQPFWKPILTRADEGERRRSVSWVWDPSKVVGFGPLLICSSHFFYHCFVCP